MKIRRLILLFSLLFFLSAGMLIVLRLFVGGGEDAWICVKGQWVKHGKPRAPKPIGGCQEKEKITPTKSPTPENSQSLNERLRILKDYLHALNSGTEAKQLFSDFLPVYTDDGHNNPQIPKQILPFTYYYSQEADITVSICNINQTVFICPGKLDRLIQSKDYQNCQVTKEYLQLEP